VIDLEKLLKPFVSTALSEAQLRQLERYLDLLVKWNAKMSLTAVRDPEQIVRRHFGESLFTAEKLNGSHASSLIDVGSGAGFPGLPIKIVNPELHVTLVEAQQKKAVFLREVVRALGLENVTVHCGRAEEFGGKADIVTLRAVEKFESVLPIAASLVGQNGRLALLIGASQAELASRILPQAEWQPPLAVPASRARILLIGGSAS
jgi:16S rRNA (guanine527-N7)-methyltransferase